jgi:hypothetical protein
MRKLAPVLGIVLALVLLGCGGGGSSGSIPAMPHSLAEVRGVIKRSIDSKLAKLGRPPKEIACVNRNIAAMTERQIAARILENAPVGDPSKESPAQIEGPLGKGCP